MQIIVQVEDVNLKTENVNVHGGNVNGWTIGNLVMVAHPVNVDR